jgi:hypothetical protein
MDELVCTTIASSWLAKLAEGSRPLGKLYNQSLWKTVKSLVVPMGNCVLQLRIPKKLTRIVLRIQSLVWQAEFVSGDLSEAIGLLVGCTVDY